MITHVREHGWFIFISQGRERERPRRGRRSIDRTKCEENRASTSLTYDENTGGWGGRCSTCIHVFYFIFSGGFLAPPLLTSPRRARRAVLVLFLVVWLLLLLLLGGRWLSLQLISFSFFFAGRAQLLSSRPVVFFFFIHWWGGGAFFTSRSRPEGRRLVGWWGSIGTRREETAKQASVRRVGRSERCPRGDRFAVPSFGFQFVFCFAACCC